MTPVIPTRLGRVLSTAAATIGCLLLTAVPAHSAPNKPFTVAFSEGASDVADTSNMPAGMTLPFTLTITSVSNQQTLGSANMTLPTGYVVSNLSVDRPAARQHAAQRPARAAQPRRGAERAGQRRA